MGCHIEEFQVLFPTPKMRLLEMIEPSKFSAKLEEPAVAVDPTSNQKDEQLPTYNAYSPDGDVTAPLVYVNYGLVADYEELAPSRRLRQGGHRHCPLWRILARYQA
jgi:N-acetylated-alpha-linked acidic dipeptidase